MADPIYVVTLNKREDLDGFYSDMESDGYKIHLKRPISRNTHYYMTDVQAETLRGDSRVRAVEKRIEDTPGLVRRPAAILNNISHPKHGDHRKGYGVTALEHDWAKLHSAGTTAQRNKGVWGWDGTPVAAANLDIYNDGRHVDIVTCDNTVSFDCAEWDSTSVNPNQSRFVQYEWWQELNTYVSSIDDDGATLLTGPVNFYISNAVNTVDHGTHVTGTIAGRHYGWAPEANIYALQCLDGHTGTSPAPSQTEFDYLRAFHKYKPINPVTGKRNATISNHSWGFGWDYTDDYKDGWGIQDIDWIKYRGTTYNSGNPGPSGWTMSGIEADFGFGYYNRQIPSYNTACVADVEDAIEDGIIVICAASNDNLMIVPEIDPTTGVKHVDFDNTVTINGLYTFYYNRGSAPGASPGAICVGNSEHDKAMTRADGSNYGPRIDIWAPGSGIPSATRVNVGAADTKYGGHNWFGRKTGTSMASPQVSGIAAMLATNKYRLTSEDVIGYLQQSVWSGEMTWDTWYTQSGIASLHNTASAIVINANGSTSWRVVRGGDRNGCLWAQNQFDNKKVTVYVGDYLAFYIGMDVDYNWTSAQTGHPFYIKTSNTTGTGNQVSGVTNQGTTGGASGTEVFWDTTGVAPGTYYGVCGNHSSMSFEIVLVDAPAAVQDPTGFTNADSCRKGSLDNFIKALNPRPTTGYIGGWYTNTLKGKRDTGKPYANRQIYPRPNGLHEGAPGPLSYTLAVTANGSTDYVMTGADRNTGYTAKTDPVLTIKKGDTINFEMNAAGHPLWISIVQGTGQPAGGNIPTGIVNNGTASGATITWDTSVGVIAGTYYYNCEHHSGMTGIIFVNA